MKKTPITGDGEDALPCCSQDILRKEGDSGQRS